MKSLATFLFLISIALGHLALIDRSDESFNGVPQDILDSVEQVDDINQNSFKTWLRPTN